VHVCVYVLLPVGVCVYGTRGWRVYNTVMGRGLGRQERRLDVTREPVDVGSHLRHVVRERVHRVLYLLSRPPHDR
jgi:hypothetical protein